MLTDEEQVLASLARAGFIKSWQPSGSFSQPYRISYPNYTSSVVEVKIVPVATDGCDLVTFPSDLVGRAFDTLKKRKNIMVHFVVGFDDCVGIVDARDYNRELGGFEIGRFRKIGEQKGRTATTAARQRPRVDQDPQAPEQPGADPGRTPQASDGRTKKKRTKRKTKRKVSRRAGKSGGGRKDIHQPTGEDTAEPEGD